MKTFEVTGSHGTLTVDCQTGRVLDYQHDDDDSEYSNIERFDLEEWRSYYGKELVSSIDILDLGFWYYPNKLVRWPVYGGPEQDWRNEFRIHQLNQVHHGN